MQATNCNSKEMFFHRSCERFSGFVSLCFGLCETVSVWSRAPAVRGPLSGGNGSNLLGDGSEHGVPGSPVRGPFTSQGPSSRDLFLTLHLSLHL